MLFEPLHDLVAYYRENLKRFTNMVRKGDFERLLRPGKFLSEPSTNLETLLRFNDVHFGGIVNATKEK